MYDEERQLLEIALKIVDVRKHSGLSQKELAQKAHITQQQLSRIEQGVNCNMLTFLKVCQALGITIDLGYVAG
jgi:DNA-binding XRE family transcriptional regulator